MSAIGDAFAALRKVILIEANLSRVEKDIAGLADELRRTRDYAAGIDRRVAAIEGMLRGFSMARAMPPALPED